MIISKLDRSRETSVVTSTELREAGFIPIELNLDNLATILDISAEKAQLLSNEFSDLQIELSTLGETPRLQYFESVFDLGMSMARLLYVACREIVPKSVVETGVAAGMSSCVILSALQKNGSGDLLSFDISTQVGELIPPQLRSNWKLKILPLVNQERVFRNYLEDARGARIFLHDSDHSDYWQCFEFDVAFATLNSCDVFLFDDVSLRLLKHVSENFPTASIIVINEGRKYSAVIRRNLL